MDSALLLTLEIGVVWDLQQEHSSENSQNATSAYMDQAMEAARA